MRAILHIGGEKTGTSTFQTWCEANRAALARCGVLYPLSLGFRNHTRAACYAAARERVDDLLMAEGLFEPAVFARFEYELPALLRAEITASGCHTVLVSNEHLSTRIGRTEEVARIVQLLHDSCSVAPRLQILHYVRRQDEALASIYSTDIKSGRVDPFAIPRGTHDPRLNPLPALERWEAVCGAAAMHVGVFDRRLLQGGDIVQELAAQIGLDLTDGTQGFVMVPEANRRLGAAALEFLRLFNAHVPRFDTDGLNQDRLGIVTALETLDQGDTSNLMSAAEAAEFLDRFDIINADIARRFAGRADGVLFPAGNAKTPPRDNPAHDPAATVRIAAALWTWQRRIAARHGFHFPAME